MAEKSAEEEFFEMIEPSFFDHKFKKPMKKMSDAKREGQILGRPSSLLRVGSKSRNSQLLKQSQSMANFASQASISAVKNQKVSNLRKLHSQLQHQEYGVAAYSYYEQPSSLLR